ncbi:MAG: endonuclease Q family protein [Bacteroidales bacterium]|nr:endonuclease Q family protein [Bacteroidales bacterium]MCF8396690.1 endonuclease Q family protein [Bacteroidales bacterium]
MLYKYHKVREGHLIKCFVKRIKEDYTRGDLKCPNCGEQFARPRMIRGQKAHKIIQGKVFVKN